MGKTKGIANKSCLRKSLKLITNKCYCCGAKIQRGCIHYVGMKTYCDKCFYEGRVKT